MQTPPLAEAGAQAIGKRQGFFAAGILRIYLGLMQTSKAAICDSRAGVFVSIAKPTATHKKGYILTEWPHII